MQAKCMSNEFEFTHDDTLSFPADFVHEVGSDINTIIAGTDDWTRSTRSIWMDRVDINMAVFRASQQSLLATVPFVPLRPQTVRMFLILDRQPYTSGPSGANYTDIWESSNYGTTGPEDMNSFLNRNNSRRFRVIGEWDINLPVEYAWATPITGGNSLKYFTQKYLQKSFKLNEIATFRGATGEPSTNNLLLWAKFADPENDLSSTVISGQTRLHFVDGTMNMDAMEPTA